MRKLLNITLLVGSLFLHESTLAQSSDRGNINLHYGSIIAYSTYSLGYEGFDLIGNKTKHSIRPVIRFGGWKSTIQEANSGTQAAIGVSYLYGGGNHFFEHSSELVSHFDRGLKGQKIVLIGFLYRPFIGYRYQPVDKRIILRIGAGWKEVVQFGVGFRL